MAAVATFGFAPSSAAVTINTTTPGLQTLPGVVRLQNGSFAVFYSGGTAGGILGRLVGADGQPAGGEVRVSQTATSDLFTEGGVSAAVLANGNVVVTWTDTSAPTNVLYRLYDPNLSPLTDALSAESSGIQNKAPDVAALTGGGFVIAMDRVFSATDHDIYFQRFDAAGALAGSATALSTSGELDEIPTVTGLSDGGFAIAFDRVVNGLGQAFIAVRNADGGQRLAATGFDFGGDNRSMNATALAQDGQFLVAFSDTGWGGANNTSDVTVARFSSSGTVQARLHASTVANASESRPTVSIGPDGFAAVAYMSNPGASTDVFASLIDPAGNVVKLDARLLGTAGAETFPAISWVDRSHVFVASFAGSGAAGFDNNSGGVAGQVFELTRTVVGDGANDSIVANTDGINNHIFGGAGNDSIISGAGADLLLGGDGIDVIYAGDGADYLQADAGPSSTLVGEGGADQIYGGAGNDYCVGGAGDDAIVGLGGVDSLYGGDGDDYIVAGDGLGSVVDGGAGANSLWGANGADYMVGGEGADLIVAGAGSDYLFGNAGADTLYGGQGTDYLFGNAGNDFIWTDDVGQPQSTDYVYVGGGTGVDTVADFTPGDGASHDVVVVSPASGIANFAQAHAAMVQVGVYTVLTMSGGDQLYLYNVQPFQLTAADFLFF